LPPGWYRVGGRATSVLPHNLTCGSLNTLESVHRIDEQHQTHPSGFNCGWLRDYIASNTWSATARTSFLRPCH